MNNFRQFFTVAVTAFVVTFPFAFVAIKSKELLRALYKRGGPSFILKRLWTRKSLP